MDENKKRHIVWSAIGAAAASIICLAAWAVDQMFKTWWR